jgi:hypothetical protein
VISAGTDKNYAISHASEGEALGHSVVHIPGSYVSGQNADDDDRAARNDSNSDSDNGDTTVDNAARTGRKPLLVKPKVSPQILRTDNVHATGDNAVTTGRKTLLVKLKVPWRIDNKQPNRENAAAHLTLMPTKGSSDILTNHGNGGYIGFD